MDNRQIVVDHRDLQGRLDGVVQVRGRRLRAADELPALLEQQGRLWNQDAYKRDDDDDDRQLDVQAEAWSPETGEYTGNEGFIAQWRASIHSTLIRGLATVRKSVCRTLDCPPILRHLGAGRQVHRPVG
jgi:hypothetical protein